MPMRTRMSTNMPTDAGRTEISVRRPPGGGRAAVSFHVSGSADRPTVRPMLLSSDSTGARVALVPDGALLLAGDAVRIDVAVGAGARLELVEPGGTVAYGMDGGTASWDVGIDLAPAASLVWAGEPFVVCEGARVTRTTDVRMAWGAVLAMRESLVLGRHEERFGRLRQEFRASGQNGAPILHESLEVGPESSPLLLGGGRVLGSVLALGHRLPRRPELSRVTHLDLAAVGSVARAAGRDAHDLGLDDAWRAACAGAVSSPGRSVPGSRTPGRSPQPSTRPG